ncbi:Nn.00g103200.m01.CDS01 [Neocucurbitaria sp. VM-36]
MRASLHAPSSVVLTPIPQARTILPALFAVQAFALPVAESAVQEKRDVDVQLSDKFYIGHKDKRDVDASLSDKVYIGLKDKRDVDASLSDKFYIGLKE